MTTGTPPPTPEAVTVAYPLSLEPLEGALHACAELQAELALIIEETPAASLHVEDADLLLWLGEPPQEKIFSAPLAWEQITVIANRNNPIDNLSEAELRALLSGQTDRWNDVSGQDLEVALWVYPEDQEVQEIVEASLLAGERISSHANLAPGPAEMLEAVAGDEAALGFLPRAWLSSQVKEVRVDPAIASAMRKPVLALAEVEPRGAARQLLSCLQSPLGQEALDRTHDAWSN